MIVRARVPLRLGLAGGGTDLSPYCDKYGGAVLNVTINRHAYAFIERSPDEDVHFQAHDLDITESYRPWLNEITGARLRLHAGVARRMAIDYGRGKLAPVRVTSFVDAPPGSGLGSSSALVVALVQAFAAYYAAPLGPYDIAHLACEIERVDLSLAGGRQDQYAGTFGGMNFIEFLSGEHVIVNPLRVPAPVMLELEASIILCSTGVSRASEAIIVEQQRNVATGSDDVLQHFHSLKVDAQEMKDALLRGQISRMAEILNRSWLSKKNTAVGVSTSHIDMLFQAAMANGAIAGKVSGAGGGGFMIFIVPPERRTSVIRSLRQLGAEAGGVHFSATGAECWSPVRAMP